MMVVKVIERMKGKREREKGKEKENERESVDKKELRNIVR